MRRNQFQQLFKRLNVHVHSIDFDDVEKQFSLGEGAMLGGRKFVQWQQEMRSLEKGEGEEHTMLNSGPP